MLSHYSAFKVAENFRVLAAVHPGRIDLGIGRAPGSDQLTALAMTYPGQPHHVSQYPQQVMDLLGHLSGTLNSGHAFAGIRAGPGSPQVPQVWMLGSRYDSAYMAAQFGLPFSYAHFFGIGGRRGTGHRRRLPAALQAIRVPCRAAGQRRGAGPVRRH